LSPSCAALVAALSAAAPGAVFGVDLDVEGAATAARQPYGAASLAQGQALKQAATRMAAKAAAWKDISSKSAAPICRTQPR
jgi:hypothetical protein